MIEDLYDVRQAAVGQSVHLQAGEQAAPDSHRHAGPQVQAGVHVQGNRRSPEGTAAVEFEETSFD